MKSFKYPSILIQSSLLATLMSCSDATQFTEKTEPLGYDATVASETESQTVPSTEADAEDPAGALTPDDTESNEPYAGGSGEETSGGSGDPIADNGPGPSPGSAEPETDESVTPPSPSIPPVSPAPPSDQIFSACESDLGKSLVATVYELPAETRNLPSSFSGMSAADTVCLSNLNIADRDFMQGFPGVANLIEWFALDITYPVSYTHL